MSLSLNRISSVEEIVYSSQLNWKNKWDEIPSGIEKLKYLLESLSENNKKNFTEEIIKNEIEKRLIEANLWDGERIKGIGLSLIHI